MKRLLAGIVAVALIGVSLVGLATGFFIKTASNLYIKGIPLTGIPAAFVFLILLTLPIIIATLLMQYAVDGTVSKDTEGK